MNRSDILVPLNLEKQSFEGLKFASRMAADMLIRTTLLYVVELNIFPFDRRVYDELCREYHERLRVLAECCFKDQPRLRVRVGKAYQEIIAEAKESDAELIVMEIPQGRRRRRLFGLNTVERVVREAPCLTVALSNSRKIVSDQHRHEESPFSQALGQSELICR